MQQRQQQVLGFLMLGLVAAVSADLAQTGATGTVNVICKFDLSQCSIIGTVNIIRASLSLHVKLA